MENPGQPRVPGKGQNASTGRFFLATDLVTPGAFNLPDYRSLIALDTAGFSSCVFVLGTKQET